MIFTATKLKYDKKERLKKIMDSVQYSCGSVLQDIDCSPQYQEVIGKVYVRASLTCADKVEVPAYSCGAHNPVCIHYGTKDDLISGEQAKPVYPTCSICFSSKPKVFRCKRNLMASCSTSSKTNK